MADVKLTKLKLHPQMHSQHGAINVNDATQQHIFLSYTLKTESKLAQVTGGFIMWSGKVSASLSRSQISGK